MVKQEIKKKRKVSNLGSEIYFNNQKQRKKHKLDFNKKRNVRKSIRARGFQKKIKRIRKLYRRCKFSFNLYLRKSLFFLKKDFNKKKRCNRIYIRFTQNNVFCTLLNKSNKISVTSSSGKYKIKTSKKVLKFSSKIILNSFIYEIFKKIHKSQLLINIIAPKFLRKKIIKQLKFKIKNKNILIEIQHNKSFNGCRPKKQRRKKRKGFRIAK